MPQRQDRDEAEENRNEEGGRVRYVRRRRNRYPYAEPGGYPEGGEPSYYQPYISNYTPDEDAAWLGGSGSAQNDWVEDGMTEDDVGRVSSALDEEVGGGGAGGPTSSNDHDEWAADIPVYGWVSGASDRRARSEDEAAAERNREVWRNLAGTAPTVDQLAGDTYLEANEDEYGDMHGGPSELAGFGTSLEQRAAAQAMRQLYENGGYTEADESARRLAAMERGQQLRGANQAALQQSYARGGGGGGMELGARLSGTQALAQGQAMSDAAVQQAAMQRAMQGLQGWGSMENTFQDQEMARRNALDAFNQQNLDWRRGRESRNTAWSNRGEERRGDAYQQAYGNRERVAAGMTNQYGTDVAARQSARDRATQRDQGLLAGIGEILDF